jgi:hypothetical protein
MNMSIVLSDKGAQTILEAFFNNDWPAGGKNLTAKLFTNDVTPTDLTEAGDLVEASGGGYASKTLTNGSWTIASGNNPRDAVYAEQVWTFTGPLTTNLTIYGIFVIDADGYLVYSDRLTYPFTPDNNGDQLKVTPRVQLSKGTPS